MNSPKKYFEKNSLKKIDDFIHLTLDFSLAAIYLLNLRLATKNNGLYSLEPILFLFKHAIELHLKLISILFSRSFNAIHDLKKLSVCLEFLENIDDKTILEISKRFCLSKNLVKKYLQIYPELIKEIAFKYSFKDPKNTVFRYSKFKFKRKSEEEIKTDLDNFFMLFCIFIFAFSRKSA